MTRPGALLAAVPPEAGRDRAAMAEVRAAISFLTRLPVTRAAADLDRSGAAAFGLVGAGIGLAGSASLLILGLLGPRLAGPASVIALAIVVIASGGLHLDGLADTADALTAPTARSAERARTDPRAGPAGVAAIVLDLLLAASLLAAIAAVDPRLAAAALVAATTGSRTAAPIAAWIARRRTPRRDGLGGWFSSHIATPAVVASVITTLAVTVIAALVAGSGIALGMVVGATAATVGAIFVVARRGRLDGDGYGAIVEITFVAILAGIAVVGLR